MLGYSNGFIVAPLKATVYRYNGSWKEGSFTFFSTQWFAPHLLEVKVEQALDGHGRGVLVVHGGEEDIVFVNEELVKADASSVLSTSREFEVFPQRSPTFISVSVPCGHVPAPLRVEAMVIVRRTKRKKGAFIKIITDFVNSL